MFVIFASGLKYVGMSTTALGWVLCAVLLAVATVWLVRARPWANGAGPPPPTTATGSVQAQAGPAGRTRPDSLWRIACQEGFFGEHVFECLPTQLARAEDAWRGRSLRVPAC